MLRIFGVIQITDFVVRKGKRRKVVFDDRIEEDGHYQQDFWLISLELRDLFTYEFNCVSHELNEATKRRINHYSNFRSLTLPDKVIQFILPDVSLEEETIEHVEPNESRADIELS
jgi:hypothetical protein